MGYMTLGYENILTLMLALGGFIISLIATFGINNNYSKYKKVLNNKRLSGQEVARKILDANGLNNIHVVSVSGELSDHYDPSKKVVRLSNDIFSGETIAAMSVAAHECGHAIQDKVGYSFMKIRSILVPFVNFVSYLGYFSIVISLFAGVTGYLFIGILMVLATLVFQLVTLPVEFDASKRALEELERLGITEKDEIDDSKIMLRAAAFTYVAGVISTIISLLRLLIMFGNSRRDD